MPVGSSFWICVHLGAHALDHVERVGIRQNPDAHEHGAFAGETHFRVVIFRAEHHIRDVAQTDEFSPCLDARPDCLKSSTERRSVLAVRFT